MSKTLMLCTPDDVRGISDHAMAAEEREEHMHTWPMGGITEGTINDPSKIPVVALDGGLALREGRWTGPTGAEHSS